jgi:hypothetical protein
MANRDIYTPNNDLALYCYSLNGQTGFFGSTGPTGTHGETGPTGLQGLTGVTGPTGSSGGSPITSSYLTAFSGSGGTTNNVTILLSKNNNVVTCTLSGRATCEPLSENCQLTSTSQMSAIFYPISSQYYIVVDLYAPAVTGSVIVNASGNLIFSLDATGSPFNSGTRPAFGPVVFQWYSP